MEMETAGRIFTGGGNDFYDAGSSGICGGSGCIRLETILMLSYRKPMIRSIDVVNELGYSKPSVSVAMKNLRENGYISMDHEGYITLEPSGRKIAEMIYERHTLLTKLLVALDVPREVAVEDACRIEHVISPQSFKAIKEFAAAHLAKIEKANRTDEPEK